MISAPTISGSLSSKKMEWKVIQNKFQEMLHFYAVLCFVLFTTLSWFSFVGSSFSLMNSMKKFHVIHLSLELLWCGQVFWFCVWFSLPRELCGSIGSNHRLKYTHTQRNLITQIHNRISSRPICIIFLSFIIHCSLFISIYMHFFFTISLFHVFVCCWLLAVKIHLVTLDEDRVFVHLLICYSQCFYSIGKCKYFTFWFAVRTMKK